MYVIIDIICVLKFNYEDVYIVSVEIWWNLYIIISLVVNFLRVCIKDVGLE